LLDLIGEGAFAPVYRAESQGNIYAVKISRGRNAWHGQREASFLEHLRTRGVRGVVLLVDSFMADQETHCLVMELLRGVSLEDFQEYSPGRRDVLPVMRQAAEALEEIHQAGVAHRDIKPENIYIDAENCQVKFIDFGLACGTAGNMSYACNQPVGSRPWMSPELLHYGDFPTTFEENTRGDVWALGVVFYQLAAGEYPFDFDQWAGQQIDETLLFQTRSEGGEIETPAVHFSSAAKPGQRRFLPAGALPLPPNPRGPNPRQVYRPIYPQPYLPERRWSPAGEARRRETQSRDYLQNREKYYRLPPRYRFEIAPVPSMPETNSFLPRMLRVDPVERINISSVVRLMERDGVRREYDCQLPRQLVRQREILEERERQRQLQRNFQRDRRYSSSSSYGSPDYSGSSSGSFSYETRGGKQDLSKMGSLGDDLEYVLSDEEI